MSKKHVKTMKKENKKREETDTPLSMLSSSAFALYVIITSFPPPLRTRSPFAEEALLHFSFFFFFFLHTTLSELNAELFRNTKKKRERSG